MIALSVMCNLFRANLCAALRDVAVAESQLFFQQRHAIAIVQRMHLQPRDAHKKSRPAELRFLIVIAQDVTNVLAKKTLDALPEFLHAIRVFLIKLPVRPFLAETAESFC